MIDMHSSARAGSRTEELSRSGASQSGASQSGASQSGASQSAAVPLERLEAQICELAGQLAAATCRFLLLVGDFDDRQGWASWDMPSCAAWLAWKCQLAPGTAREHVRVARALRALPLITAEFAAARMSYAKVRALTRIATSETEPALTELARPMTAGQLDRFVAAHRRVSHADDIRGTAIRRLTYRVEDDGSLAMSVHLPPADGAVLLRALRAACDDLEHPHREHDHDQGNRHEQDGGQGCAAPTAETSAETSADGDAPAEAPPPGERRTPTRLADALVDMAADLLAGKISTAANPDIYQVIVHVGPEALTADPADPADPAPSPPRWDPAHPQRCHLDDGPAIGLATAQAIACNAAVSWMLHDHKGGVLDVGRRHRRPSPALRRAVRERDRSRCQFPGCNSRRTDLHHIRPWARGGKTCLTNLISLCGTHHRIVHGLGYLITAANTGRFAFFRADGTRLPASPPLPEVDGDLTTLIDTDINARSIIPIGLADRFDLDMSIWACFANARVADERHHAQQRAQAGAQQQLTQQQPCG